MYKICSLFAGVGGIDLGFLETNKCEIAYANEFDKYAVETYEKNFDCKCRICDISFVLCNELYRQRAGDVSLCKFESGGLFVPRRGELPARRRRQGLSGPMDGYARRDVGKNRTHG